MDKSHKCEDFSYESEVRVVQEKIIMAQSLPDFKAEGTNVHTL